MSQTLLALFALAVVGLLTYQSQQDRTFTVRDVIDAEVTAMSARVATDVLNGYRPLPYDAAVTGGPADDPSALSPHQPLAPAPADRFGSTQSRAAAVSGTPGAAGTLTALDGATATVTRDAADGPVTFRVETVVGYVAEADGESPAPGPTKLKVATVRVTPLSLDADTVVLSQLYACGSGCDW